MLDRGRELEHGDQVAGAPPRAVGAVRLAAVRRGGSAACAIGALRQEGSLKLLFPRGEAEALEAVLLNTAGGLTGGDRMRIEARVEAGAGLRLSTQAAERAYRASAGTAIVDTHLTVGAGARLDWVPQETLLYDGSALDRRLTLDLAPDARALVAEAVLLGRRAMGETVTSGSYREAWQVRQGGRLVFADRLRLTGDMAASLARSGADLGCFATVLLAAPGAAGDLDALRRLVPATGGASALSDDLLLVRLLATDGWTLRRDLVPILEFLGRRDLPKVWRL